MTDLHGMPEGRIEIVLPPAVGLVSGPVRYERLIIGPVCISRDGGIQRTDEFTTTDAAALAFWDAVERLMPAERRK